MFKLLLCLFGLVVAINAQCNNGVEFVPARGPNVCACYSGFTGQLCENDDSSTCSPFASVDPLNTTTVGEIANYRVVSDVLNLDVFSAPKNERYFESLSFAGNLSCAYPFNADMFTKSFNVTLCNDVYSASVAIPELVNCGFDHIANTPVNTIEGAVRVVMVDSLGAFREVSLLRRTTSHLGLVINLPVTIDVNASAIVVYSAISLTSAITEQAYEPQSNQIRIVMTTSVQYPFKLTGAIVSGPAFSGTVDVNDDEVNECSPTEGSPCFQQTTLLIPTGSNCKPQIDGAYQFTWDYACSPLVASCPVVGGSDVQTATAFITVDNPCATVEVQAHIEPQMQAYSDENRAFPSLVYLMESTVYFKTAFTSDVSLVSASVSDLSLEISADGRAPEVKSLVASGTPTPLGSAAGFLDSGLTLSDSHFSFNLVGGTGPIALFQTINPDSVFTFTVKVTYQLTYRTTFGRRRDIVIDTLSVSQTLVLDASASKAAIVEEVIGEESSAVRGAVFTAPFLLAAAAAYNNL